MACRDLKEQIIACLASRSLTLEGIRITAVDNTVVLQGKVQNLVEKRQHVESCHSVSGTVRVVDDLIVDRTLMSPMKQTTAVEASASACSTENVATAMQSSSFPALRRVRVSTRDGIVTLHGIVPSFHVKQLAQATALAVPGIDEVQNELQVISARQEDDSL